MTILALEFSSEVRGVALLRDGQVLGTAAESDGRDTHAFALIRQALAEGSLEREAVEIIAVGLGPGSYAGIRVSIAIAQGWQLSRGVKLLGVGTADVMAEQVRLAGRRGRVHVVIDAQRDEFYHAAYELDDTGARPLEPMRLASVDDVERAAETGPILGAAELAGRLAPFPVPVPASASASASGPSGFLITPPDAAALGRLAATRADFLPGAALQPVYLRETSFVKAPPPRIIAIDPP